MRLLMVEDDPMIGEALCDALRADAYAVDWVRDAETADTALRATAYDAVLLDLGLPGADGLSVLQGLRHRGNLTPVLILTARDAIAQRVAGLDAGADDYVLKPFDLNELLARLRAHLRRSSGRAEPAYCHGDIEVRLAMREVLRQGQSVSLSAREWAVLEALVSRPGIVLSRAQLEDKLYGWNDEVNSNAVEVYIHGLRRKLGAALIQTVRGLGYRVHKP